MISCRAAISAHMRDKTFLVIRTETQHSRRSCHNTHGADDSHKGEQKQHSTLPNRQDLKALHIQLVLKPSWQAVILHAKVGSRNSAKIARALQNKNADEIMSTDPGSWEKIAISDSFRRAGHGLPTQLQASTVESRDLRAHIICHRRTGATSSLS
jgi:hypothetical protein